MTDDAQAWRERGFRDAVLAGDTAAWRRWLDECYANVEGYVRWRCGGSVELTQEVLQETWLTAVRRLASFDPDQARFAAWVCGIAANVLRNQLRSRTRRSRRTRSLDDGGSVASADGRLAAEQAERITLALAALSERHERVLRAKYLEQHSVTEIAAAWGESEKAIESLLTRARQAFREAYGTPGEDTP